MTSEIIECTEVRIPLYDREWAGVDDLLGTLLRVIEQVKRDGDISEPFIEIEWEPQAQKDAAFMALLDKYGPQQFYIRYERE